MSSNQLRSSPMIPHVGAPKMKKTTGNFIRHTVVGDRKVPMFQETEANAPPTPMFTPVPLASSKPPTPQKFGQYLNTANQSIFGIGSNMPSTKYSSKVQSGMSAMDRTIEDQVESILKMNDDDRAKEKSSRNLLYILKIVLGLRQSEWH